MTRKQDDEPYEKLEIETPDTVVNMPSKPPFNHREAFNDATAVLDFIRSTEWKGSRRGIALIAAFAMVSLESRVTEEAAMRLAAGVYRVVKEFFDKAEARMAMRPAGTHRGKTVPKRPV